MDVDFKRIFSLDVFIKINKIISIFINSSKTENSPNQKIFQIRKYSKLFFYILFWHKKSLILKYNLQLSYL